MPPPNAPSVPVFTPGLKGAAALWNPLVAQPLTFLLSKPRFRARLTVAGNPTKGGTTFVPWDTVDEDPYTMWGPSQSSPLANTIIVATQPGWHMVSATVTLTGTGATGTNLEPTCAINGTSQTGFGGVGWTGQNIYIPTSGPMACSNYWEVYCSVGDQIQIGCYYGAEPAANLAWNTTVGQQPHVEICWSGSA